MNLLLQISGTIGLALAWIILAAARRHLSQTTLTTAWYWMLLALLLWSVGWTATIIVPVLPIAMADQLWYATAVSMLCPFIAVLGARRPVSRVWTWFVIMPLLIVLEWPAIVMHGDVSDSNSLSLEGPAILGFAVVAIMGLGNYVGTRYAIPVLLAATALVLLVAPFSTAAPNLFSNRFHSRIWATLALVAAVLIARRLSRRGAVTQPPFDMLWNDFRSWFGIVWAKRIQDRVNETAEKENWPHRLQPFGFVATEDSSSSIPDSQTHERIEQTMRWLLRRFADPEWIDARLTSDD